MHAGRKPVVMPWFSTPANASCNSFSAARSSPRINSALPIRKTRLAYARPGMSLAMPNSSVAASWHSAMRPVSLHALA